jgi:prepilin-type N-terminal cleavage/methylation domain-containing protein/prepilin-type processing-associated H-X9-DG protein
MIRFKKAFTLIELLVVIAIIAILAAILFPVFAQAKLAAKKTASLSNVKHLGTSTQIYVGDWDDVTPSIWGTIDPSQCNQAAGLYQGCSNEWWMPIFPYFKSIDLIYSSERQKPDTNWIRNGVYKAKYVSAYGYNWGPFGWRGGGLLEKQLAAGSLNVGKSMTSITNPAGVFMFGDTYDTPRATVGIGFSGDDFTGYSNSSMRYGGSFNYAFTDGHAKALKVKGGILPGAFSDYWIMPANTAQYGGAYCSDPDTVIQPEDGSTSSLNTTPRPPTLACGAYAQWVVDNTTATCAGGKGTACHFGN